ncbi:hypothetical protein LTR95_002502 [Oleoguttula sp. CCFEE 5521]
MTVGATSTAALSSPSVSSTPSTSATTFGPTITSAPAVAESLSAVSTPNLSAPTAVAPAPAPSGSGASNLSSAQAVGVSIGAFSAMITAAMIVYLILWCRRRRAMRTPKIKETASFDFIDESPPRFSPFRLGFADPRGPLGGFSKPRVELEGRKSEAPRGDNVGKIIMHGGTREHIFPHRSVSPDNDEQTKQVRTISQLLPARPEPALLQMTNKALLAGSAHPAATLLPSQSAAPPPQSQQPPYVAALPARPKPPPKTVPPRPGRPNFTANFSTSPDAVSAPSLSLHIPARASPRAQQKPNNTPLAPMMPIPAASAVPARLSDARVRPTQSPASANSYLPTYYTSAESRTPPITPISASTQTRRPVPATIMVTKPTYPPRAVRSNSVRSTGGGSETSFESGGEDDITPPLDEEGRRLSAVPESTSPVSGVRYPQVPKPSGQVPPPSPRPALSPSSTIWEADEVSRSPSCQITKHIWPTQPITPQRVPTNASVASSTLAAKRRGNNAAHNLEQGLNIDGLSHSRKNSQSLLSSKVDTQPPQLPTQRTRQDSPLKGYGRQTSTPPGRPAANRKPSYAGTGYGYSPETPRNHTLSPGPRVIRTDREPLVRSPLWEPKLTPSRRGEDLYLNVSLGSPMKDSPATAGPRSALGYGSTAEWRH